MSINDITKFEHLRKLMKSDPIRAMSVMASFSPQETQHFNLYLAHQVLQHETANYRGMVIEMSIHLEGTLSSVLAQYFSKAEKQELLNALVFDRMELSRKMNLFKSILKHSHESLWSDYHKNLKSISDLIDFRNNLSHSIHNSSDEYKNKLLNKVKEWNRMNSPIQRLDEFEVGFFKNNEWKYQTVSVADINNYLQGISDAINLIHRIADKIVPGYNEKRSIA